MIEVNTPQGISSADANLSSNLTSHLLFHPMLRMLNAGVSPERTGKNGFSGIERFCRDRTF